MYNILLDKFFGTFLLLFQMDISYAFEFHVMRSNVATVRPVLRCTMVQFMIKMRNVWNDDCERFSRNTERALFFIITFYLLHLLHIHFLAFIHHDRHNH